jgi:peptide methionine sulfoxide reductase MsrA
MLPNFWENHDPTQGMRQGNDVGTQYRSSIYTFNDAEAHAVEASREMFQKQLNDARFGEITTEIAPATTFYYAEDYHQQYLAKNPSGYTSTSRATNGAGCGRRLRSRSRRTTSRPCAVSVNRCRCARSRRSTFPSRAC